MGVPWLQLPEVNSNVSNGIVNDYVLKWVCDYSASYRTAEYTS